MPTDNLEITCICSPRRNVTAPFNSNSFPQPKQSTITKFFAIDTTNTIKDTTDKPPEHDLVKTINITPNNTNHQSSILTMYYQNVRGLRTKRNQFDCNSSSDDYSAIVLTETWLKSTIYSSEYFNNSFVVYRNDREATCADAELGGGNLIVVRNSVVSTEVKLQGFQDIEHTCIKIRSSTNANLFIYVAYLPPPPTRELFMRHQAAISSIPLEQSDTIFIMGDFNIPHANWIFPDDDDPDDDGFYSMIPMGVSPLFATEFLHEIFALGCCQINSIFNDLGRLLDLVFTNDSFNVEVTTTQLPIVPTDRSHPPLIITCGNKCDSRAISEFVPRRKFHRTDFVGFCNFPNELNIAKNILPMPLDQKIEYLHDVLNQGISLFVPFTKQKRFKKPWWNAALHRLKNERNKEWKRFQTTGDSTSFNRALVEFDAMNTQLHKNYITRMESLLKENSSKFWKFVKSKRQTDGLPKLLSEINPNSPVLLLDEYFIFEELLKIKTSVNAGPDGVHPLILKNCASVEPLALIFNESLQTGIFPVAWKRYSVTPIFKKGARSSVENYRCIAKLQTIAKFFEHCVNILLVKIISPKISSHQHGFMKHRSTTTNLMDLTHYSMNGLSETNRVDVVNLDFSKAFDRVDRNILMRKLATFDTPNNVLAWLDSYLSNRRQYVKI